MESPVRALCCWARCSSPTDFAIVLVRQLHRVVGRIYVAGVFVAAPLGFYLQYFQERMGDPRSFSIAGAVDAALWMITTGIAMVFILKGEVQEHRQWMTRSFAVALVFLEVRVIGGVTGWENLGTQESETIVWACLAFSILSADLVLQWQQLGPSSSVVRRHSPASPERMLEAPLGNPAAFACSPEGELRKIKVVPNSRPAGGSSSNVRLVSYQKRRRLRTLSLQRSRDGFAAAGRNGSSEE